MEKIKVASFFAGIGGFDRAFEQAGFEVNFQCEINNFCGTVLRHHWPKVKFATDISTLEAAAIPKSDVWCGGFPCQDLSVARGSNDRHGLKGARSGLFYKLVSLAKVNKPKVILFENVHGLLNSNGGRDFLEVLTILGGLNYAVSWRLVNSRYFGVPQSRPRVYVCAWLKNPVASANVMFEPEIPAPVESERKAFLETSWRSGNGPITPKVAFCLAATSGRHTGTDWSRTYIAYKDAARRLTPLECEKLQGFPAHWTAVNASHLNVDKLDSLRYHALGNAVSVPVVAWVAERISTQFTITENEAGRSWENLLKTATEKWALPVDAVKTAKKLSTLRATQGKIVWPNSGMFWKGSFVGLIMPTHPCQPVQSDLLDIIEKHRPSERYFLSKNAAVGILRRVDSQQRHLFPYLRKALERMSGAKSSSTPTTPKITTTGEVACVLP